MTTVALAGAAVLLGLALVEHLRGETLRWRMPRLRPGTALAVLCGLVALFEIASMIKAVPEQAGAYSLAADVVTDPTGSGCGLSSHMLVETDPAAGVLPPAPGPAAVLDGFAEGALPATGPGSPRDVNGDGSGDPAVTAPGPVGTPVLGSYRPEGGTGELTTGWYALPDAARQGAAPLVVGVAGQLGDGTSVAIELGRSDGDQVGVVGRLDTGEGSVVSAAADPTGTGAGGRGWRDVRFDLGTHPEVAAADRVRVVAEDHVLVPEGWVAVAPPRVPQLTPLLDLVGTSAGYLDWPVAFPHPCLRPFGIDDGVAELPAYRLLADPQQRGVGENWSAASSGGPLAWLTVVARQRVLPTYLDGQWGRDVGQLRLVEPYDPQARSTHLWTREATVWGWTNPAPMAPPPPGIPDDYR